MSWKRKIFKGVCCGSQKNRLCQKQSCAKRTVYNIDIPDQMVVHKLRWVKNSHNICHTDEQYYNQKSRTIKMDLQF